MTNTTTIPSEHYRLLTDLAAQHLGVVSARRLRDGKLTHPGDQLGTILCQSWIADSESPRVALLTYTHALQVEAERLELTPPSYVDVLRVVPNAINDTRFPEVDVPALMESLHDDLPGASDWLGESLS